MTKPRGKKSMVFNHEIEEMGIFDPGNDLP
jgi:hypothetical protein